MSGGIMKLFYLLTLAAMVGCATTGPNPNSGVPGGNDRTVITESELQSVPSSNLYEALEKLRPNFLRSRGAMSISGTSTNEFPAVYIDGRHYGDITSLKTIVTNQVGTVKYYDPASAGARFGMINASGVIDVSLRK
jgi:hypothetical protein